MLFDHLVDTYKSEIEKTAGVWRTFSDADLTWKPHEKSSTVGDILKHQLLSERRFFAQFIGLNELPADQLLPAVPSVSEFTERLIAQSNARVLQIAALTEAQWLEKVKFFDVERERIWVFWRRVLHTAHHRTQLSVYIRLLNKPVPSVYGPTADVTWEGASPTLNVANAG